MIEVKHLTKHFNQKTVVDDISFTVEKGEVLGLLGPNGAGKSTTMRIITGFLRPSSGTVLIGGNDILATPIAAQRKIGYLPENAPSYKDMSVIGFLDFIANIRGYSGRAKTRQIDKTIERCFLSEVRHQNIDTLSKGYNQRVCFAQCLLHDPDYLIMDEPTDGLDPNQKHEVQAMIREMSAEKANIFSTHNLEEVTTICSRAIIIAEGRLLLDDTPEGLKSRSPFHGTVRCAVRGTNVAAVLTEVAKLATVRSAEVIKATESGFSLRIYPRESAGLSAQDILYSFETSGQAVETLFVEEGHLGDVFRAMTTLN